MARLAILAIAAVAALGVAGCGDDDDNGNGGATTSGETTREKSGGDAMKGDSGKSGDAMKKEGDAMESEGAAMEGEASGGDAAMVANRSRAGKVVKVVSSDYGRVLADKKGEAFYLFDKEKGKKSRCYGACARAWPPVITKGKPKARGAAKASLLGTTRRKNGKLQVTYRGHPLYYYVDDSPGTILCQDVAEFGGLWLVVKPNGNPVT